MKVQLCAAALAAGASIALVAPQAIGAGGVSLSPSLVERPAKAGALGAITVTNTSRSAVDVTVTPRPWVQQRSGRVVADPKRSVGAVRPSVTSFRLAAGRSRDVRLDLLRVPASGSLFSAVAVRARTAGSSKRSGVRAAYELVGALRATPARPRHAVQAGGLRARRGTVALPVRNAGNTIDPVSGSFRLQGPRGRVTGTFRAVRVLPGAIVDLPVASRLPKGAYRLTGMLQQGGRRVAVVNRTVKVG